MKQKYNRLAMIFGVLFLAYNLIVTLLPLYKGAAFWLGYGFTVASFFMAGYAIYAAFIKQPNARSKFYGFPLARIGAVYFGLQMISGIVFSMLYQVIPFWIPTILYIVFFGFAATGLIAADVVVEEIHRQDVKLKKDTTLMRSLQGMVSQMTAQCSDSHSGNILRAFSDEIRYSDPVSGPSLQSIEGDLKAVVEDLQQAIVDGDQAQVEQLTEKARATLEERNRLCKLNKGIDTGREQPFALEKFNDSPVTFAWTTRTVIASVGVLVCVIAAIIVNAVVFPAAKYEKACALQEIGSYEDAIALFQKTDGFYAIKAQAKKTECEYMAVLADEFDNAGNMLKEKNEEVQALIAEGEEILSQNPQVLNPAAIESFENTVQNLKEAMIKVPEKPTVKDALEAEIDRLKSVDYKAICESFHESEEKLKEEMDIYSRVNNPDESSVIEALKKVAHVKDMAAITEKNDPNGLLNKVGGYTAAVYFSSDLIDQTQIIGDNIIEKGTDGGGCIEVYATVEDAEKRNAYLTQFDGSVLSSGSHSKVGTIVIRMSSRLTESQQESMTADIVTALTMKTE